jgi:hypothetical protein
MGNRSFFVNENRITIIVEYVKIIRLIKGCMEKVNKTYKNHVVKVNKFCYNIRE